MLTGLAFLFPWLLLFHVLGAIVAFGPTFAFPLIGAAGGREPQHANFALRATLDMAHRIVLPVALTMPVTGALMILVAGIDLSSTRNLWLGLAIVLYVIAIAFSVLVQTKTQERLVEMTSSPPSPGAGPPPEVVALVGRMRRGGMLLSVLIVTVVVLMVVKPGF
jgi:hypothetical protein